MFTWIPIYEETARRLLEFEDRQTELIQLIRRMTEAGLSRIPLKDFVSETEGAKREEIDPFSFFANFNREMTIRNRIELWRFLKNEWGLKADLPVDFGGNPTLTPVGAWFLPWRYLQRPEDVPLLWKLAKQAVMPENSEDLPEVFEECLKIHRIGIGKMTIGLSWIAPRRFLPLSGQTAAYLKANKI